MNIETKTILLYGEYVTPHNHIKKIINKYDNYYMRDMKKPNFNLEDYYEIHIEERFTGSEIRDYCPVATSVKKEYFQKLVETFKFLKGNFF
ncbi:hypothetical protein V7146_00450 [Gottfriedia acidiceleris]|uniref:hypothetical protein n=1 Tax=Gottfriedia acidiceleris TaxID=371036 RepID=UPI0030004521